MRVESEEVTVAWLESQETEEAVRIDSRVERWSSECQHEEYNSQGEEVGLLGFAWHLCSLVHFRCHVNGRTHFHIYKAGRWLSKAEIAEL